MPVDLPPGFVSVAASIMGNKRLLRLVKILTGGHADAETEFNRLERFAHFWVLVGRSFVRNRCPVRAAALSYTTLLALIPLLAVAIGVTSSLLKSQGEEKIYEAIDKFVSNVMPPATLNTRGPAPALDLGPAMSISLSPTNSIAATNAASLAEGSARVETAQKVVARDIHEFIQNTRSGALGVIGMLLLVYVAIMMLANIESTFNDIWGVTRGRNWFWRIILYWTTITLGPLLIAGALGLAGGSHLQTTKDLIAQMPFVSDLIFEFLPFVVLWLAFTLVYLLVPNTKVNFSAALVGGVVGGSLWHLNNLFGFLYVSRVVTNSQIYGKLGLVPVFMVGLYFSWMILLFGAQVAYAFQNRKSYLQEKLVENVNQRGREFIALRLMTLVGERFQHGEPPVTLQQISAGLGIPTKLVQQVLHPLLVARLVTEIAGHEPAYLPARPLEAINAHHILRAVRAGAGQDITTRDEPARAEVLGEFARIEEAERAVASSVTLLALVNRAQKQIEDSETKAK
jgi:membrane protein